MDVQETERAAVHGRCDDAFARVADEFARNLAERGDVGAAVAVTVEGRTVVDLWGGYCDVERSQPWTEDTLVTVMSSTKGAVALCAHLLLHDGELDLDAPVGRYWPEFAAAGKEGVLVRHVLSHQAGLPVLRDPVKPGGFYDWEYMTDRLAAETPFWSPGTAYGYHGLTFGFLAGELVRRVTGRSIGRFFADEIAGPLGLDFRIGIRADDHGRVARLQPPPMPGPGDAVSRFTLEGMTVPGSIPFLMMQNHGGYLVPGEWDSPQALAAEIPATGGVTTARSLAAMYRAVVHDRRVGSHDIDAEDLAAMGAVQSALGEDVVLHGPGRWTLGFHKGGGTPRGVEPRVRVSLSEEAFGHTGMGGSIGFCDPGCDMSFAYVMNQMAADMGLGPTCQSLVDAVYRTLGYRRERYDAWVR